jgi:hypothetical protein
MIKTYTNRKSDTITEKEIKYLLKNHDETIEWGKIFIQNIIVVYLLDYLKSYGNKFQFIVRKFYNLYYKDKKVSNTNEIDLKIILNDICDNKDWKKLLDPTFVKLMVNIYYNIVFNEESNILIIAKTQIFYSIIKLSSIWTFQTSIIPFLYIIKDNYYKYFQINIFPNYLNYLNYIIIPSVYLSFHIHKYGWKPQSIVSVEYISKIIGIIIGIISYIYFKSDFLICFISEFFYYILFNQIMINIYYASYNGICNFITNNRKLSKYQINKILVASIASMSIYFVIPINISYQYERLNLFTLMISFAIGYCSLNNFWNIISLILVLNISAQSFFNPIHIIQSIPNIFIIMNYLESDMFINMVFKISYLSNYKFNKIIKYIHSNCTYDEIIKYKIQDSSSIIKKHNPIILNSYIK